MAVVALKKSIDKVFLLLWAVLSLLLVWGVAGGPVQAMPLGRRQLSSCHVAGWAVEVL